MAEQKVYRAIGLMSGTSLDGIDAALIETDGEMLVRHVAFLSGVYEELEAGMKERVRSCLGMLADEGGKVAAVEQDFTMLSARVVKDLLAQAGVNAADIDLIGFHGHTIAHDPDNGFTWQIGDGALLAKETGIDVVYDFRKADVEAGGQGAPLLPLYHHRLVSLAEGLSTPVAVLNIGGVSNITYIDGAEEDILAFDLGAGNALLDDFVLARTGAQYDEGGVLASTGHVYQDVVEGWMQAPFFSAPAPKSLDRDAWDVRGVEALSDADGAATLTAFTVQGIKVGMALLPRMPEQVLVCGGGRHNGYMMAQLVEALGVPVISVDDMGWNGDAVEAEGFAYYAVRSVLGVPVTYPRTTGVGAPMSGGVLKKVG